MKFKELMMKKVALSLLALSLLVAGAFAEDAAPAPALKFSGYFNSGINANVTDGKASFVGYAHDWNDGSSAAAFRLIGTFDADQWGYKFRLQDTYGTVYTPAINYAYGWVKPFDGLKILGGKTSDGTFASLDWNGNKLLAGEGAEVIYSIAGATFGASVIAPSAAADDTLTGAFGAKYALDKVFTAMVTTKLANTSIDKLDVTASLDAVTGLSLTAGYVASGLATTKSDFVDVNGSYAITDVISASVLGFAYLSPVTYFDVTPAVGYTLTPGLTVGGEVDVITGDTATQIPAVTCTYVVGGSTAKVYGGYDVTAKTVKTYVDFLYSF